MAILDKKRTWTIRIGDDFTKLLQFFDAEEQPLDLTDYSFKMQIRKCKNSESLIHELESPTSIDISDAANGNITLNISNTDTLLFEEVNGVFDLKWTTPADIIETVIEGNIEILETVTK